jgi:hypothetical protein
VGSRRASGAAFKRPSEALSARVLSPEDRRLCERFLELLELLDERDRCRLDPARLISWMSAPDERTAETFAFEHLREPLLPDGGLCRC